MVTKQNTVTATATPGSWGRLAAFPTLLRHLWVSLVRRRRNRQGMPDVSGLSDRMLDDIGMDRSAVDSLSERSVIGHYREDLSDIGRRY